MTVRDLLQPPTLKQLCARAGIRPDRKSGQNFLINRGTLERIVAAVDPQPGDTILEVGAGFGTLTAALAAVLKNPEGSREVGTYGAGSRTEELKDRTKSESSRIIAIERDRHIVPILKEILQFILREPGDRRISHTAALVPSDDAFAQKGEMLRRAAPQHELDVEVVETDVLRLFDFILRERSDRRISQMGRMVPAHGSFVHIGEVLRCAAPQHELKIAANLPYSITSDFLRLLFDRVADGSLPPPNRAVLLLQREVVDRLTADPAKPSDRKNVGLLTILTRLHCTPRRIIRVPPSHFWPPPKVESAVVVLEDWRTPEEIEWLFTGVVPERRSDDHRTGVEGLSSALRHRRPSTPAVERIAFTAGQASSGRILEEAASKHQQVFLALVRRCFAARRRQIGTTLRTVKWDALGIDPTARPETLTMDEWIRLARFVTPSRSPLP